MKVNSLSSIWNIKELPLLSSTSTCIWPILCGLEFNPSVVFPVVLSGKSKPQKLDLLLDAINEIKALIDKGFQIWDQMLNRVNVVL